MNSEKPKVDLKERSFRFAVRIVKLCDFIQNNHRSVKNIANQMIRSGTSIGANIEEAKGAQSRADFLAKFHISLKEARETHYWILLLLATDLSRKRGCIPFSPNAKRSLKCWSPV